jgi:DNA-binding SARP family transcriptional activator
MAVEVRLLGPLEAVCDGVGVALPGLKSRCVLATLALNAGEVVSVDRLADALWLDAPPQTLMTQIHAQISTLRRRLNPDRTPGTAGEVIATRPPGYRLNVEAVGIDLREFETTLREGQDALATGAVDAAGAHFRQGLAMWRGPALADLPQEAFGGDAARLEDLRLAALELAIDADLEMGRHLQVLRELDVACAERPYRESLWAKRMLALYRCGRQADALAAFRAARKALVEEIGIEPGENLRGLEQAILRQDPSLSGVRATTGPVSARVLVSGEPADLASLVPVAALFAGDELLAVGQVAAGADLAEATRIVREATVRATGPRVRSAAFRSSHPARDLARVAQQQETRLLVVHLDVDGLLPLELLSASPADVALVDVASVDRVAGVTVPFTSSTHDWAALALGGRVAAVLRIPLELVGVDLGERGDASRALASAALALGRVVGIDAVPRLVSAGPLALVNAVGERGLVVTGLPEGYRRGGLGPARLAMLERTRGRIVMVHAGPRPGVLAPAESGTRFSWSLGAVGG